MRKICNLATAHLRDNTRIFKKECLVESKHYETHYITCDGGSNELKDGIHIHAVKRFKTKILRAIFAPFEVYKKTKSVDADIYVLHDPELLLIALLLQKRGKCVIWDCHEYYLEEVLAKKHLPFLLRIAISLYLKFTFRLIVPRLNAVVVVSEAMAKLWLKYRVEKIFVLHNYALLRSMGGGQTPDFECSRYILFTGSPRSQLLDLVRALKICKNRVKLILRLKLVPSDNFGLSEIKSFTEVNFKKNVPIEEIISQSKRCFAAISFCGYCSNLPYPLTKYYEYMAETLPIIALQKCPNKFLKTLINNNDHPLGLVVDSDPQSIADAIDYLYENKEVARTMGMNGRKAFETKYNFESEADGFLKFLEEVSQSKNPNK